MDAADGGGRYPPIGGCPERLSTDRGHVFRESQGVRFRSVSCRVRQVTVVVGVCLMSSLSMQVWSYVDASKTG